VYIHPYIDGNGQMGRFLMNVMLAYWGEATYRENTRYAGINREEDFSDLHITRLVAELAGLIRKYKGKFILGRDCRDLLARVGLAAIYPRLLKVYIEHFNWGYRDNFPEIRFIQTAFLFTLYLLQPRLHGQMFEGNASTLSETAHSPVARAEKTV